MKFLIAVLMLANAAVFMFGAMQHTGVPIGTFHEPVIIPASIVETVSALSLLWGGIAVLRGSQRAWSAALIGNIMAIVGVAVGMISLAAGRGPRTASNDLYHRIMLALAITSIVILALPAGRAALRRT
jgi:hypothetical protein